MEISQPTPDRIPALADMLGRAFVDEPMLTWSMGGDPGDLAVRLAVEFRLLNEVFVRHGALWQAGDGLGAACWIPPGLTDVIAEANAASDPATIPLTDDGGVRRASMWEWVESQLPAEPAWFLDHVAVDPANQGLGVGRALIEFGLARADADGVGVLLETGTPRNVPYYERFGFSVISEGDAPGGGPHIWFMRR
jgi:GNAT superfamily N-acetyltransferase